jgi:hypothetical protein
MCALWRRTLVACLDRRSQRHDKVMVVSLTGDRDSAFDVASNASAGATSGVSSVQGGVPGRASHKVPCNVIAFLMRLQSLHRIRVELTHLGNLE